MSSPHEARLALPEGRDLFNWWKQLRDSWERFVTECNLSQNDPVRPFILERWKVAKQRGIDPLSRAAPVCSDGDIDRALAIDAFAHAGKRALDDVGDSIAAEGHVLILSDATGRILYTVGDKRLVEDLRCANAKPGGVWNETYTGPNGVGSALACGRPALVFGPEHFCEGWHRWFCLGAPVKDPLTGEFLGVVDITGFVDRATGNHLPFILAMARAIEYQLGEPRLAEHHRLIEAFHATLGRRSDEPLAVFNRIGRLVESTDRWRDLAADTTVLSLCSKVLADLVSGASPESSETHIELDAPSARRVVIHPVRLADRIIGAVARLERGSVFRTRENQLRGPFEMLVGDDPTFQKALKMAARAAACNESILITGETGTGKELVARAIHESSARSSGPLVCVNCAALPRDLAESELFGYEGGAFTGARREGKPGRFELANGGTLFLDELGELPAEVQAKLLRVLEERSVVRVGGVQSRRIDVRVIAATNRKLFHSAQSEVFRRDLFYRLAVIEIELPPLRARGRDVLTLARAFLDKACREANRAPLRLSAQVEECFLKYPWPGNVRELRNVAARLATLADADLVRVEDLPICLRNSAPLRQCDTGPLHAVKEDLIMRTLEANGGNVSLTARQLNIDRSTIYRLLRRRSSSPQDVVE